MFRRFYICFMIVTGLFFLSSTVTAQEFPIVTASTLGVVAFDGTNFLVGHQGHISPRSVCAQLVSANGSLVGPNISLGVLGRTGGAPHVSFDGTNYLLFWCNESNAYYGQFINTSGNLVATPFLITSVTQSGKGMCLAFGGDSYMVILSDNDILYAQRINKSGNLLGAPIRISNNPAGESAIAFDGTNFLVTFRDQVEDKVILGQFISKSGELVGSNFIVDGGQYLSDNPVSIAFDGSRYLVCFHEQAADNNVWNLFARFVTPSGTVDPNRITVRDSTNNPGIPVIAFDETNYLITWTDNFYKSGSVIMGRFFNTSGVPIGNEFKIFDSLNGKVPFHGFPVFGNNKFLIITNRVDPTTFTNADVHGTIIQSSSSQPLIGTWDKTSGPGDPTRYNFLTDSTADVIQSGGVHYLCKYTTFQIPLSSFRGIDLSTDGVVGWRGIYNVTSDLSTFQIEGYWHTGLPTVSTPAVFTSPTTYTKVLIDQIPNGGFEDWTIESGIEIPSPPWVTNNLAKKPQGVTYVPVTKSSDHYPEDVGNYSIKMENNISFISQPNELLPYYGISYGFSVSAFYPGYNGPTFPIDGHPTSFCGYYKFLPQNNDTMTISLALYKNGIMVANSDLTGTTSVPNWTSFNIPISTYATADSAQIGLSAYHYTWGILPKGPYGNSVLYVDNLSFDNLITSVQDFTYKVPNGFKLEQNYPNPFNPTTTINFSIPKSGLVTLKIYDMLGREIQTLVNQEKSIGNYEVRFDGSNLSSGVYFYRLQVGNFTETKKLILMK